MEGGHTLVIKHSFNSCPARSISQSCPGALAGMEKCLLMVGFPATTKSDRLSFEPFCC